jgi:hypothetical protein
MKAGMISVRLKCEEADAKHHTSMAGRRTANSTHHERRHLQPRRALAGILDGLRFGAVGLAREGGPAAGFAMAMSAVTDQDETNSFQRRVR